MRLKSLHRLHILCRCTETQETEISLNIDMRQGLYLSFKYKDLFTAQEIVDNAMGKLGSPTIKSKALLIMEVKGGNNRRCSAITKRKI